MKKYNAKGIPPFPKPVQGSEVAPQSDGKQGAGMAILKKLHFRICNEPVSMIAPMKSIKGADFVFSEDMNGVPFMGYWLSLDPQRARRFTGDDFDD